VKRTLRTLALALALGLAAGVAQAQTEFSDAKLESFVVAAIAVDEKIREWNPRIQAAQNEQEAAELREQASNEVLETIDGTEGMSVEEYQQIGQAAQADPELATRINEIYGEKTGK
jgi:Domain of unknown function (DUF4168)